MPKFPSVKKLLCILDICQKLSKLQVCLKEHKISPGQFFPGVRALASRPKGHGSILVTGMWFNHWPCMSLRTMFLSLSISSLSSTFLKKYINGENILQCGLKKQEHKIRTLKLEHNSGKRSRVTKKTMNFNCSC